MPALEREYQFWMQDRSVSLDKGGRRHVLNRYNAQADLPRFVRAQRRFPNVPDGLHGFTSDTENPGRPESYTDDLELAEGLSAGNERFPADPSCSGV